MAEVSCAKLFVHGDADDKAPVQLSRDAFAVARAPKKLVVVPGGGHAFKGQPNLFEQAVSTSLDWLEAEI